MPDLKYCADKNRWLDILKKLAAETKGIKLEPTFYPYYNDKWFDKVEQTHQPIREFIGGVSKTFDFQLEDMHRPMSSDRIKHYLDIINKVLPAAYWAQYKIKPMDLQYAYYKMPSGKDGHGRPKTKNITWGKHMLTYLQMNKVSVDDIATMNNIMAKMGTEWSHLKTEKMHMYITISTDPADFVRIGHYGADHGSCFRNGRSNATHKMFLGASKDTFVVYASLENINDIILQDPRILCRCWGVVSDASKVINICNYYSKAEFPEGNILYGIKHMACSLLGSKNLDELLFEDQDFTIKGVYHNQGRSDYRINWSVFKKSEKANFTRTKAFVMDTTMYDCITACCVCGEFTIENCVSVGENRTACNKCAESMATCTFSKEKIVDPLFFIRDASGTKYPFSRKYINRMISMNSRSYVLKEDCILNKSGNFIPKWEVKEGTICSGCSVNETENNSKLCSKCIELDRILKTIQNEDVTNYFLSHYYSKLPTVSASQGISFRH